jgi:hypothetical protein
MNLIRTEKRSLGYWRVVCISCAEVKNDDKKNEYMAVDKVCCEGCRAPVLHFCAEFLNIKTKCRVRSALYTYKLITF